MTDGKTADKPSSGLVPDPSTLLPPDEPIQILDDDGRINAVDGYPIDDLDDEDFRALYRHMVVARRIDKQAINLQRQGQLGVYASLLGQEAAQIGGAYALAPQDWVFPSYREMGTALVRGVNPGQMLHQWRGTWLSGYDPYEFRFGLLSIPIGTQALHGTRLAERITVATAQQVAGVVAEARTDHHGDTEGDHLARRAHRRRQQDDGRLPRQHHPEPEAGLRESQSESRSEGQQQTVHTSDVPRPRRPGCCPRVDPR